MANALARVLFTASDPFNVSDMCPATGLATACVQMKRTSARNAQRLPFNNDDYVIIDEDMNIDEVQRLEDLEMNIDEVQRLEDLENRQLKSEQDILKKTVKALTELDVSKRKMTLTELKTSSAIDAIAYNALTGLKGFKQEMTIQELKILLDDAIMKNDLKTYNLAGKRVSTKETQFKKNCHGDDIGELNSKDKWKKVKQVLPKKCRDYLKEWAEAEANFAAVWLKNPKLPFFHKNMILVDYFTKTIESLRETNEGQTIDFESVRSDLEEIEAPDPNADHFVFKMVDYRQKVMALLVQVPQFSSNPFVQGHLQLQRNILSDGSNYDSPVIAVILGPSASGKTHFAANELIKYLPSHIQEAPNDVSKAFLSIVDGGVVREAMQSWQYAKAIPQKKIFGGFSDLFEICNHAINVVKKNLANFMIDQKMSFFLPDTATNWGTGIKLVNGAAQYFYDDLLVDVFRKVESRKKSHTIVFSAVVSTTDVCKMQGISREKTEGKKYDADSYGRGITAIAALAQHVRAINYKNTHSIFNNDFIVYYPGARVDKNEAVVEYFSPGKTVIINVMKQYDQIKQMSKAYTRTQM